MPLYVFIHCKVAGPKKACRRFIKEVLEQDAKSEWGYKWDLAHSLGCEALEIPEEWEADEHGRIGSFEMMTSDPLEFRLQSAYVFPLSIFMGFAELYPELQFDVACADEFAGQNGKGFFNPPDGKLPFQQFDDQKTDVLNRIGATFGLGPLSEVEAPS